MLSTAQSFILTILFNIVIGIIIPTPGRHLKDPEKVHHHWFQSREQAQRLTGITLGLLDRRSREVTWRVWSSVHRTSSVNSTEHSGQKSSQVQSLDNRETSDSVTQQMQGITCQTTHTYPWVLQFVYNVITCEGYETWQHIKDKSTRKIVIMIQQSGIPCHTYQLYVQQIHRAGLMNLHQSGSSQWLQTHYK